MNGIEPKGPRIWICLPFKEGQKARKLKSSNNLNQYWMIWEFWSSNQFMILFWVCSSFPLSMIYCSAGILSNLELPAQAKLSSEIFRTKRLISETTWWGPQTLAPLGPHQEARCLCKYYYSSSNSASSQSCSNKKLLCLIFSNDCCDSKPWKFIAAYFYSEKVFNFCL